MRLIKIKEKEKWVLETKGGNENGLIGTDLDAFLAYYNCSKRYTLANEKDKKRTWRQMKEKGLLELVPCVSLMDKEELMLLEAGEECTDLMDTALGRAKRRKMSQCKIALRVLSNKEFNEIIADMLNAANMEPSEGSSEAV